MTTVTHLRIVRDRAPSSVGDQAEPMRLALIASTVEPTPKPDREVALWLVGSVAGLWLGLWLLEVLL